MKKLKAYDVVMYAVIIGIFTVALAAVISMAWLSYGQI